MFKPLRDGLPRKGRRSPREFAVQVGAEHNMHLLCFDRGSVVMVRKDGSKSSRCPECHQALFQYDARSCLIVTCNPKHTGKTTPTRIEIHGRRCGRFYPAILYIYNGKPKPAWEHRARAAKAKATRAANKQRDRPLDDQLHDIEPLALDESASRSDQPRGESSGEQPASADQPSAAAPSLRAAQPPEPSAPEESPAQKHDQWFAELPSPLPAPSSLPTWLPDAEGPSPLPVKYLDTPTLPLSQTIPDLDALVIE